MSDWNERSSSEREQIAEDWLKRLEATLSSGDIDGVADLLKPDGYWRDLLTLDWRFTTLHGAEDICAWLSEKFSQHRAYNFRVEGQPYVSALGPLAQTLEFFFTFETEIALGRGHIRLVQADDEARARAFTVLTSMKDLKGFPERAGRNRVRELPPVANQERDPFAHSNPDVLIVGAGQAGLMMGARLRQLEVKTLIVERAARVGDIWRKRYRALKLHNDISMNHFPYLPFPESWPTYLPKDKVADWLEFYSDAMDLDIWTSTTLQEASFDPVRKHWNVSLRLADGTVRLMKPRHIVSAMGVAGLPHIPKFAGTEEFRGSILHSSQPFDDIDVEGKKAVIVGAGTSAHDIAQNFCLRGAAVTMVQRSSITVLSLEPSGQRAYQLYRDNDGVRPIYDTDVMGAATPYSLLAKLHGPLSRSIQDADRELLDGLRARGFLLDNGEDDTGFYMKLLRYHAGYYLNIGASDLIVEGKIAVKSGVGVARLTKDQVILSDGSALDADIVVFATGYQPLQEQVRRLFGDHVANKIGPIWGIGPDNELRSMFAPTAQENFYILGGGFPGTRFYSRFTARYIKASLAGLVPTRDDGAGAKDRPADDLVHEDARSA
ncbi:MAG: flavin-containing monooxygenase [Sphingobium sp.]